MSKDLSPAKIIKIAKFAKALGHPVRLQICQFLAQTDGCYFGTIDEIIPLAKATVSQHLKALREAGLIQSVNETPKVRYTLNHKNWNTAKELFDEVFAIPNLKKTNCKKQ